MKDSNNKTRKKNSGFRKFIIYSVVVIFSCLTAIVLAEWTARTAEVKGINELISIQDPDIGWLPKASSSGVMKTQEFTARFSINNWGMNDKPVEENIEQVKMRIMVLGDSHTFASGVSTDQTWPNVLETMAFKDDSNAGTVYNLGVIGYSLGQYLVRMRSLEKKLKPHLVIIGFSMATDLYDLIPPERGGFVYVSDKGRVYFDLDNQGELIEKRDLGIKARDLGIKADDKNSSYNQKSSVSLTIRRYLRQFALYRRLKRSNLAMWVATHYRPGNKSLWPGMDTALKINLNEDDKYRWKLGEKIIRQIALEAHDKGRQVMLVNIPYLAQVYDEVWNSSFGSLPDRYNRWIAGERLEKICKQADIYYVDTTKRFVEEVKQKKKWLHYPHDAHPTPDGHRIIAEKVLSALNKYKLIK